jgi:hypothetical protein
MPEFRQPSPALVISIVALIVALGGTSYAALRLPANSVGTNQLKNNAVTTPKIKNGVVTGSKIKLSTLGTVPSASFANSAGTATTANSAGTAATANSAGTAKTANSATTATSANSATTATTATIATKIGALSYRSASFSVPVGARATGRVSCDPGTFAVGGGTTSPNETSFETDFLIDSHPTAARTGWEATVENFAGAGALTETVVAVCVPAASTG